jgi:hypothetical protein
MPMADEPKHDATPPPNGEPFEEALDAAEVFTDLANEGPAPRAGAGLDDDESLGGDEFEAGAYDAESDAFADEFELPAAQPAAVEVAEPAAPEPAAADEAAALTPGPAGAWHGAPSIGELFKPVVKHSPPSKIRIEADSIGALFHRFVEQR